MPGGTCRELGFTSITDNASTSPKTQLPKASNPKVAPSPIVNLVDTSADTSMMEFPQGTNESDLSKWSA
jgi:hypothetical protein